MCSGPCVVLRFRDSLALREWAAKPRGWFRSAFARRFRARAIEDEHTPDASDDIGVAGFGQGLRHGVPLVVGHGRQTYLDEFVGVEGDLQFGNDTIGDAVGTYHDHRLEGVSTSAQNLSFFGVQHVILSIGLVPGCPTAECTFAESEGQSPGARFGKK